MKKATKVWLITAAFLMVAGFALFAVTMEIAGWDFTVLNTEPYEENTYEIAEDFRDISIYSDTADISFVPAEDGVCRVVCCETKTQEYAVSVEEGVLAVRSVDEGTWRSHIGIAVGMPEITLYLPAGEYGVLFVEESTGDVAVPKGFSFESISIAVSTGDVSLSAVEVVGDVIVHVSTGKVAVSDVRCKNLFSTGNTGDMVLENVIAAEKFLIERTTGDVKFSGCDAAEISVITDTGSVSGTFLSEKSFAVWTDTGDMDVPDTTGGKCEIITDTGDITVEIA